MRVWQERRILPESLIRHHIRELDSLCNSSCFRASSRRPLRNERAFDDPIRQMEGMQVDEYGRYLLFSFYFLIGKRSLFTNTNEYVFRRRLDAPQIGLLRFMSFIGFVLIFILILQQCKLPASWVYYASHAEG